jgi:hypothetical protein
MKETLTIDDIKVMDYRNLVRLYKEMNSLSGNWICGNYPEYHVMWLFNLELHSIIKDRARYKDWTRPGQPWLVLV